MTKHDITNSIGAIPYRMAFAGGWIDQPFVSRENPAPPGSMVVVGLKPTLHFMDRSGMASGTRKIAMQLWQGNLPKRPSADLVRELYATENEGKSEPSGSQDMIGLIYPGVNRLDFDFDYEGGLFPKHIESNQDPAIATWLEDTIHVIPIAPRPEGYNPLGVRNITPRQVERLGQSGKDCYDAILRRDTMALGASMNDCMKCWEALLPHTVQHPAISLNLMWILTYYQSKYAGAMYSGCGGGYLYVVSETPVPGSLRVNVRTATDE